jgi:serralysin
MNAEEARSPGHPHSRHPGDDTLIGTPDDDTIDAGAGNDTLIGEGGTDTLIGGIGNDVFAFISPLGPGNIDVITDMVSGGDLIVIDNAQFTGMAEGLLAAGAFVLGSAALDADDRILYNQATGAVYFDADGNGSGAAPVEFLTLQNMPTIVATDFFVLQGQRSSTRTVSHRLTAGQDWRCPP